MNATLRNRLILVEQLFLIAVVAQDETAREEFSLELSRLIHHFKVVEEAGGDLDDDTRLLLSRVAQVITATTQCMLECEDILKDGQTGLMSCSNLPFPSDDLFLVPTNRPTITPYLLFPPVSSSRTLGILGNNRLLDACAYRWLMQNVHNPYPTSVQLQTISEESKASVTQVELWFQEARDSVGWTRLSHEFFTGSVNATTTAAKRVYLEQDDTIPFCIVLAFSSVKAFMETLFAEHPASPTLTSQARSLPANDSTDSNDLANNEELEEDTTPPPSIAGCKRKSSEYVASSPASDLHRPLKRPRAQFLHQVYLHSEGIHPSSDTGSSFKRNTTMALTDTSAMPVTSVQLSGSSFSVDPKPSPDPLALNSIGQRQTDICGNAMILSPDSLVSHSGERNKQISERSPLVLSEGKSSPYVDHGWNSTQGSVPTFTWPVPPSLDHPPSDSTRSSHITVSPSAPVDLSVFDWNSIPNPLVETTISTNQSASVYVPSLDLAPLNFGVTGASQITVRPDAPIDLSVFDWNSIPNPLVETPISMNQPTSVYVPSSDLAAMNCELPDPLFLEQSTESYPLDDLGSLEDFSFLQFPIPTTFPPDVSASPASFSSDNSTFASPEMDWSVITDIVNQFTTFSAETPSAPSPSSTIDAGPSTPENPTGSLLPPPPHEVDKPISLLDPSIPPSAFLPAEPGIFTDDASSMWSLLCGLS